MCLWVHQGSLGTQKGKALTPGQWLALLPKCRTKTDPDQKEAPASRARYAGKDKRQPFFSSNCLSVWCPFALRQQVPSTDIHCPLNTEQSFMTTSYHPLSPLPPFLLQIFFKYLLCTTMMLGTWRTCSCPRWEFFPRAHQLIALCTPTLHKMF